MAICPASRMRPLATRLQLAVAFALVARSTPATGARMALPKGMRPKASAARAEISRVKSKTLRSGLRPVSIFDHAASIRVAAKAKSQPSAEPEATSSRLSESNWRKREARLAPTARRRLNSRCRTVLRACTIMATFVQAINSTSPTRPSRTLSGSRYVSAS